MTDASKSIPEVKIKTCRKCESTFIGKYCKPCTSIVRRAHYAANKDKLNAKNAKWRADNPEKSKLSSEKYRAKNPGKANADSAKYHMANRDKINAAKAIRGAINYAKNPEPIKAANAAWRAKNPTYQSEYYAKNPNSQRIYAQNRRALKLKNGGKLSKGLSGKLFKLQKGRCACCGKPLGDNYHLDHIMPLVLGGANEDSNMQLLTRRCNNQKCAKHPIDFMQSRGFLI